MIQSIELLKKYVKYYDDKVLEQEGNVILTLGTIINANHSAAYFNVQNIVTGQTEATDSLTTALGLYLKYIEEDTK